MSQTGELKTRKLYIHFPTYSEHICVTWKESISQLQRRSFENVDGGKADT